MILEILGIGAAARWAHEATSYEVTAGTQCNLCGWRYRHGPSAQAVADRMFREHVRCCHPHLLTGDGS